MESVARQMSGQQPASVKIYNAVYSSVQVYECMVRGIAVMRRRADSYVNATQILKVAGVDKGRRTKILEKEVLPGKHEIVQGGYGKYQGTWIPLERGRELSVQYGIGSLLSPLFEFIPNQQSMQGLPNPLPNMSSMNRPRPLSAAASYPNVGSSNLPPYIPAHTMSPNQLGPAPIMPGSALRLLNQGRAQGLFTPSTTSLGARPASAASPGGSAQFQGLLPGFASSQPSPGASSHTAHALKRTRTDSDIEMGKVQNGGYAMSRLSGQARNNNVTDIPRPSSTAPSESRANGDQPSPAKRARTDPNFHQQYNAQAPAQLRAQSSTPQPHTNGIARTDSSSSLPVDGRRTEGTDRTIRLSTKPHYPRGGDKAEALKDPRRAAIMSAICTGDDAQVVMFHIREAFGGSAPVSGVEPTIDWDVVLDDMGHTSLHVAASLAHIETVKALVEQGAEVHRGNCQGETPLMRAILSTHNFDKQSFYQLVELLHPSIWTIDTAKRSVLHHATLIAGVKGRAPHAKYYLEGLLSWIAVREAADFRSIVDVRDEHGDTALNIAARVGNRSLVRTLLDVGANRQLANKLGLRPGDFGVESDELNAGIKAEDVLTSLRSAPSLPVQKSQDVIADLTAMIQQLSSDFTSEIKSKQEAFDVTQAHLRAATRELAEQRKQISLWQQKCGEQDQVVQRIRNTEKALSDEDEVDWSGRTEADGQPANKDSAGPAFLHRGTQSTIGGAIDVSSTIDNEVPLPATDSPHTLIRLRRMKLFQDRIEKLLSNRLKGLQGASAEKEYQYKKIVSLCTNIPLDKVDDILENLVIAVQSESQIIDIGRVSGFMQKVSSMQA